MPRQRLNYSNLVNRSHPHNRGLLAWWLALPQWRGGASWRDIAGGCPGTLTGMTPASDWVGTGPPGGQGALDFDGSDDAVFVFDSVTPPAAWQSLGSQLTVDLTFRPSAVTGSWATTEWTLGRSVVNLRQESAGAGYKVPFNFGIEDSTLALGVSAADTASDEIINGSTTLLTNTWYHAGFSVNGDAYALYLNGRLEASGTFVTAAGTRSIGANTTNLTIGARTSNTGTLATLYTGLIGSVRIWQRPLSAAEHALICEESRQGHPDTLNRIALPRAWVQQFNPFWALRATTIAGELHHA